MKQADRDKKRTIIDRKNKRLIFDTPIHTSMTKQTLKDNTIKENIKHIAHIPNEILIFLFEKFKSFSGAVDDAAYIDAMLNSDEEYYLSFYDQPAKEQIELQITNHKINRDDGVSVKIGKRLKTNSYVFTVSKKVFNELENDKQCNYRFRFVIDLDLNSDCFKNSVVYVGLV